jgi:hypothetical protein
MKRISTNRMEHPGVTDFFLYSSLLAFSQSIHVSGGNSLLVWFIIFIFGIDNYYSFDTMDLSA